MQNILLDNEGNYLTSREFNRHIYSNKDIGPLYSLYVYDGPSSHNIKWVYSKNLKRYITRATMRYSNLPKHIQLALLLHI